MLWDRGYWEPEGRKSPEQALAKGDFKVTLEGERLHGCFVLVGMRNDRDGGKLSRAASISSSRNPTRSTGGRSAVRCPFTVGEATCG